MKRLAIITALILAATILAAGRTALPVQSDVETISGTVARADTRMPLPHVQLELLRESDKRLPTGHEKACRPDSQSGPSDRRRLATTDENGKFEFENVAAGRYYLFAEHEGFLTAAYGQRGHFPIPQVLEVASHADRTLLVSDSGRAVELPAQTPFTPPSLTTSALRGGLGRDQQGLTAGAASAIRDASSVTELRGGLGPGQQGIPVGTGAPSAISNGDRNILQNISFALTPAPTIAGTVVDDSGMPVTAASVEAYRYRFTPMNGKILRSMRTALTDDRGAYRLFWLEPGHYLVTAGRSNRLLQPWLSLVNLTPNLPDPQSGIPPLFYPAATTLAEAVTINVDPGVQSAADFKLRDRPRFNAQVRLVGSGASSDASLIFVPAGGDFCAGFDYAIASKAGTFSIRDVPEATYVMAAVSGRDVVSELVTIKVDRNLPPEISIARTKPTEVRGTVYFEGATDASDLAAMRVNLTRAGQELSQVSSSAIDPMTKRFAIPGVGPGTYYTTLDLPPGYYVKDIVPSQFDQTNPEDCAYRVADSQVNNYLDSHGHFDPQKALRIPSVIPNAASCVAILIGVATPLYGYVHDVQDRPFAGAFVVGIPNGVWRKEEDRGLTPPDRYITAVSDDAGFFELRALPSVEYKLYAFESLDPNDIYDPEFAERFRNREIFTYRLYENRNGTWVSRKIANYAVAFQNQWCAENSLFVRERCYLTVIPAEAVDR